MRLIEQQSLSIAESKSKLSFATTGGSSWKVWDRFISFEGEKLFHIGNICGTCEFFFHRVLDRFVPSFEIDSIRSALESGIGSLNGPATAFAELLPDGEYVAALFEVQPKQAGTEQAPDYFTEEQRLAWRGESEGESEAAGGYYRGESRLLSPGEMLFEFLIPLYDAEKLDPARVEHYRRLIRSGLQPTSVAIGVLDVKESQSWPEIDGREQKPECPSHWCFANYLLDGHHKVRASSLEGKPISLLTFISLDHSWQLVNELMARYKSVPAIPGVA